MILKNITSTLKLITGSATNISVFVMFDEILNGNEITAADIQLTNITTATTTTILSAPASTYRREIKQIVIHNTSPSNSNAVTINQDENGTLYEHYDCVIGGDEKLILNRQGEWIRLNKTGVPITENSEPSYPTKTHTFYLQKNSVGAAEAAGFYHFMGTGSGIPNAWAIGTSGLAGRAVLKSEVGFLPLPTTTNKLVITRNGLRPNTATTGCQLVDVLFVNNGLVVTTTTAQTVNTVALPSRDNNQTANGVGCLWGLLVTAATTNASAITNMTVGYTNQDGTAGRTGTVTSFPATAALGTFVIVTPQSGDTGIKSIQSVTLGTSLVTGAVSLMCVRIIDSVLNPLANAEDLYSSKKNVAITGNEAITCMIMATGSTSYIIQMSEIQVNEYV